MRPNPSFELTRYGRPVWPGRSGQLKSNYKGFPKKRNYPDGFSFITFSCSGFVSRRGSMKKMADC